jgi:hypothetical protein
VGGVRWGLLCGSEARAATCSMGLAANRRANGLIVAPIVCNRPSRFRVPACRAGLPMCRQAAMRIIMCRNIKTLHNFKPPATDEEIHASSLQFVRKLSGFTRPSKANQIAFSRAIDQVAKAAHELLASLVTNAPPRDREVEASRARARAADRFHASDERRAT